MRSPVHLIVAVALLAITGASQPTTTESVAVPDVVYSRYTAEIAGDFVSKRKLRADKAADQVVTDATFKLLNLEHKKKFIFGSKEFLTWAKYVTKLKKNNADASMINTLLKHYDEGNLARLIAGTKGLDVHPTQKLAANLQEAQFNQSCYRQEESRKARSGNLDDDIVHAYRYFIGAA
ncbi:hypothetical protein GN958_ATG11842 [Phytophthora infestans]|uniref:RxLR effector protein n=1 Tax=Phytophthora infestans TaxID=4787 RepID=A0A8S9UCQ6_PHYIN|nr:hypothetical protein GN958_ATG11842 [Phytophthora infestans]